MPLDIQNLIDYILARLKERFTGKIIFTFDKGTIVEIQRHTNDTANVKPV